MTVMMLILVTVMMMTVMMITVMTTMLMIREEYDRMFALGVSMYGQMTAGSYCYIGPQVTIIVMMIMMLIGDGKDDDTLCTLIQGIVHGTTLTVLNAGRNQLGTSDLAGKVSIHTQPSTPSSLSSLHGIINVSI